MAYAATAEGSLPSMTAAPGVVALQRALLWLVGASVAIVFIEPSPYELLTLAAAIVFFATGLRLRLAFVPLMLLLFLVNIGYSICAVPLMDKPEVANWIATSWYMAVTVIFFAMVVSEDTAARLDMLRRGLIMGGLFASTAGIAGYFNLVPGGHDLLTLYDRARGTFKDPNVLGAFLVLPSLFALQSVVSDDFRKSFRSTIALGIMALAVLLAFSRAAWGGLAITAAFMLALMVLTSRSHAQRSRIIVIAVVVVIRRGPLRPVRSAYPGRRDGARFAVRHRTAAVPPLLSRRYPQFLLERLHVRRLDRRHLLSGAGVYHRDHGVSAHLRPRALATGLSRNLRGVSGNGRRKLHHRHRPLAAFLDDAGRDVGHVCRCAAL
jgi:hypothetical protein